MGTRHQPHCPCFCVLACLAVRAAGGRTGGAAYLALMWDVLVWALTHTQPPVSRRCDRGLEKTDGEDVHGHALHGLVRHRSQLGFPLDVPVIGIAGLTDRATLPDLLDGGVETDLVDLKPALHVQGLLLDPWVHHLVVPSLT